MKIQNSLGLYISFLENGLIEHIVADPIRISLRDSTPFSSKSGANFYLRKTTKSIQYKALLGPQSNSSFKISNDTFLAAGSWEGIDYVCRLQLSEKSLSWQWRIDITNKSEDSHELDLIYVQDTGLKTISKGLINEYYVSQYIERQILYDKRFGSVICCRQNMRESTGNQWLMMACYDSAVAASVDGMQFYGKTYRETGIAEGLLTQRMGGEYSGESSVLALQEHPFKLNPGEHHKSTFISTFLRDHPEPTSEDDLGRLPDIISEFNADMILSETGLLVTPVKNIFTDSVLLPVADLNDSELTLFFGHERHNEEFENGQLLSFFCKTNNHVVLRSKEIKVDRPHGHIMQAKAGLTPDENIVATTSFISGVFNSHLTQGNTNFNILLSVCSSQFDLFPETGQRIFVEIDGSYYRLGIPSAFEIGLNHCRWIYKHGDFCFQVRTWTSKKAPVVNMDFKVISGSNTRLLITNHFDDLNGWKIKTGGSDGEYIAEPDVKGMIRQKFPGARFRIIVNYADNDYTATDDEILYSDNKKRGGTFLVLDVKKVSRFCLSFIGEVCAVSKIKNNKYAEEHFVSDCQDGQTAWKELSLNLTLKGEQKEIAAISETLPWYGMNALVHFLTPYGLEQFSGAAWGTRDIAQGPFDLLMCMQKYDEARQVLRIIFSNQNRDGGWPQWWMFDSYSGIRADSSHGDIFYWCLIALSNYIKVTGDLNLLDEVLPYYHEKGVVFAEQTPLSEHVDRLIRMIVDSFIPGTALVPFGGGDWNDSLQPVSRELAQRMISSWTVEMNYQAFNQYSEVYDKSGDPARAGELKTIAERIISDFNKTLIRDDVVAGYGLVEEDGSISLLLHPIDHKTNVSYSLLPMNRGIISGLFTKEQALHHQELIEQHLKGPDGARLMNHPLRYQGGIQSLFQRAESSTYFGREIGLMYMHEHIRYAESLAITGEADAFLKALLQANPVAYRNIVPCSDFRQSNCYYTSSDVAFKNRYEADEQYYQIRTGNITLKGGWRIYSSGPGIYINLIVSRFLGLRRESGKIIIDPVIPHSLDGLSASIDFMGYHITFVYRIKKRCYGPQTLTINGNSVTFTYEANIYRKGGAVISIGHLLAILNQQENTIEILL